VKISKELNAASATAIVLGILQDGESYGYAIAQRVRDLSGDEVLWTDGMLYPILHRLEADGLIAARWGESETGRKRKYYQIQPPALEVLRHERQQWNVIHNILQQLWNSHTA
jgi:PadR family transcriptional regulator, regulatory protein PadR